MPKVGRPKGSLGMAQKEGRAFARIFINSPEYRLSIERRILSDTLPAGVEVCLWHFSFGKPTDTVDLRVSGSEGLEQLTDGELAEQAQLLATSLLAKDITPVIEGETIEESKEPEVKVEKAENMWLRDTLPELAVA